MGWESEHQCVLAGVNFAQLCDKGENHAGFIWTGTLFRVSNANDTTQTITTITTPSTGVQHTLEVIILNAVQIEFYVDGVLVNTSATNLPIDGEMKFQEYHISNGAGGATTSNITLREGFLQENIS